MTENDMFDGVIWFYQTVFWFAILAYRYDAIMSYFSQRSPVWNQDMISNLIRISIDVNYCVFLVGLIVLSMVHIATSFNSIFQWSIYWAQSYCIFYMLYQGYHSELSDIVVYAVFYIYLICMNYLENFYPYQSYLMMIYGIYMLSTHIMTCLYDYNRIQYLLNYHYFVGISDIMKDYLFYGMVIYITVVARWLYEQNQNFLKQQRYIG